MSPNYKVQRKARLALAAANQYQGKRLTAIYVRVSDKRFQNTDPQVRELEEYCRGRKWKHIKVFRDEMSGKTVNRPGMTLLMEYVKLGHVERVVVFKIDRLGRNIRQGLNVIGEMAKCKTAIVCTSQPIDTSESNPAGQLILHVLMCVAQFESSLISERVRIGIAEARANGARWGRKPKAFKKRSEALAMAKKGATLRDIAAKLRLGLGTVHRLLS